jgi:ubiquitin carboxyl-terminal hydrolase 5/13
MAEINLDLQSLYDWSKAEENDKVLTHLYGPGYTGLVNLGNTYRVIGSLFLFSFRF